MNADWQSWAAAGVVIATICVFLGRALGKKKRGGGCNTCGTGAAPKRKQDGF
jgi:hypothetical protein